MIVAVIVGILITRKCYLLCKHQNYEVKVTIMIAINVQHLNPNIMKLILWGAK